jgi:predicted RNA binding protein YcfA (HicA-like mRNA interferase family)
VQVSRRAQFGSHPFLVHRSDPRRRVTVAYHGSRDIPRATLANILRQAQLSTEEFVALL